MIEFFVANLLPIVVAGVGALIARSIKRPNDAQRATMIAAIADDIVALIRHERPDSAAGTLIAAVLAQLRAYLPGTSDAVLRRVAAGAVARALPGGR